MIGLGDYNNPATMQGKIVESRSREVVAVFENLPEGNYPVYVFHDENDNQQLDRNERGIPLEGYGQAENATGSAYKAPIAEIRKEDLNVVVRMVYQADQKE